jgi:hypothetical protein
MVGNGAYPPSMDARVTPWSCVSGLALDGDYSAIASKMNQLRVPGHKPQSHTCLTDTGMTRYHVCLSVRSVNSLDSKEVIPCCSGRGPVELAK